MSPSVKSFWRLALISKAISNRYPRPARLALSVHSYRWWRNEVGLSFWFRAISLFSQDARQFNTNSLGIAGLSRRQQSLQRPLSKNSRITSPGVHNFFPFLNI